MSALRGRRKLIPFAIVAAAAAAFAAASATARNSATTIKVAVLSDCQGAFGAFDNPLRGYPSVSIRYDTGAALRSVATWTPTARVRFDGFADVGIARQPGNRRSRAYPGIGAALEAPAPFGWLVAAEWGYGVRGVNTNGSIGTHVVRLTGYKMF